MKRREFLQRTGLGALGATVAGKTLSGQTTDTAEQTTTTVPAQSGPPLRWGLIGTGKRCLHLIRALDHIPGNRIIAACDIREDRLRKAAALCKDKPQALYSDYRELLKRDDLDAILIATPNHIHCEEAIDALNRGFHVMSEKPMGITVEQCNSMIEANRKSGKVLQVGLELRYSPLYQKVHELIRDGAIGKMKFVWFNEFRGDWAKQSNDPEEDKRINWRFYQDLSGGTLLEKSCHYFDLFNWFIGTRPLNVVGLGGINFYTNGRETLDHASIVVEYEDGVKATHGLSMYSPKSHHFTMIGEKGHMDLELDKQEIVLRRSGNKDEVIATNSGPRGIGGHSGTVELLTDFQRCVREDAKPLCDALVGKESIRIGLAGERAVRELRCIRMSEIPA